MSALPAFLRFSPITPKGTNSEIVSYGTSIRAHADDFYSRSRSASSGIRIDLISSVDSEEEMNRFIVRASTFHALGFFWANMTRFGL